MKESNSGYKVPFLKESLERKVMTDKEIAEAVRKRSEETGRSLLSCLGSFMATEVKIEGESSQDKTEYFNKLAHKTAKLLDIEWPALQDANDAKLEEAKKLRKEEEEKEAVRKAYGLMKRYDPKED